METTKLRSDFLCQYQGGMCDPMLEEKEGDPRVIIDRCGCIFRRSHLEGALRTKLSENVLRWFKGGGEVSRFTCPNHDGVIGAFFTSVDVITDPTGRYMEIWRLADQSRVADFKDLTQNEDFTTRHYDLIPIALANVLKAISTEQREARWDGMTWTNLNTALKSIDLLRNKR